MCWMSFSFDRYALCHVRTTLEDFEAEHTMFVQPLPSCYVSHRTFGVLTLRMSQACDVLGEKEKSAHIKIPGVTLEEKTVAHVLS